MASFSFDRAMGLVLLLLTVTLSLMMLRSPGTSDVSIVLNWADILYQNGLIRGYSEVISDLHTEYPPISHAMLYIARALGDTVGLSPLGSFKVIILAFQLMSAGIILVLSGSYWVAAAFNASIFLSGVGLGYQDVWFAPPLILAFWAFRAGRDVLGTALFLIACLTKWQPLIVAPFIAVYLFDISDFRSCRDVLGRRLFWQLAILIAMTIALLLLIFGLSPVRSLWHGMNHPFWSGTALNLPWVGEFFCKVFFPSFYQQMVVGSAQKIPLLSSYFFSQQDQLKFLLPPAVYLLPLKIFFWSLLIVVVIRAMRSKKTFTNCMLFSIAGLVTYTIWNSGVHENHLFVAMVLAFMLLLHEHTREHWAIVTVLAVMLNVNLFVFYGVTGAQLQSPVVGVDLSGIMAMLYVVVWLFLVVYVWGLKGESTNVEKEIHLPEMVVNRLFARRRRFFVTFT
jgi:hypothetical protein